MKHFLTALLATVLVTGTVLAQPPQPKEGEAKPEPKKPAPTKEEQEFMKKVSYSLGINIGSGLSGNLTRSGIDVDIDTLLKGLTDALKKNKPSMTEEEMEAVMGKFERQMTLSQLPEEIRNKAIANEKASTEFLAKNKKREGVTTTESGLQYEVLKEGKGKKPGVRDRVKVHYHGTLLDKTVFDSSVERKEPATFPVGGVIPGWVEALQLMPVGSKWKIYIPSDLAYGLRGPGDIGPDNMLIFEVELLEILADPTAPKAPAPKNPEEEKAPKKEE